MGLVRRGRARRRADDSGDPVTAAVNYPNRWCPKGLREHLAQQQTHAPDGPTSGALGALIAILDLHRPLGEDGTHGTRHTPTCGCDVTTGDARITLPWTRPPLSLNDSGMTRNAKMARARRIADARRVMHLLALDAKLPRGVRFVTVQIHYRPRDNNRRDTDNLVATLKPLCDGLAAGTVKHPGYGMVPDDIPAYMAKPEPIIHEAVRGKTGALWLEITWEA